MLGDNNQLEWHLSVIRFFNFQPYIALFGTWYSWSAAILAIHLLLNPDDLPNIEDHPYTEFVSNEWDIQKFKWIIYTFLMFQADSFFWTQLFTFGQSDLKDLQFPYMSFSEAITYLVFESLLMPLMQVNALVFITSFWWLYAADIFNKFLVGFIYGTSIFDIIGSLFPLQ